MLTIWRIVRLNTGVALVLSLIFMLFDRDHSLSNWFSQFVACFTYSQLVGTSAHLSLLSLWPSLSKRQPVVFFGGTFVLLALVGAVGATISTFVLVQAGLIRSSSFWRSLDFGIRISVLVTLVVGFVFVMKGYYEQRLAEVELERERALKLAAEAKLQSLESLVHPHFLFNALNSISSLIHDEPAKAESMVDQVSALLRYSLDSAQGGLVALGMELKIVRDYLTIQQTRFGTRLRFEISAPENLLGVRVPPLSVQTLVENCVKHTLGHARGGTLISINVRLVGDKVVLEVTDDGAGFGESQIAAGHGLATLRARLNSFWPENASLTVAGSTVRLEFPA